MAQQRIQFYRGLEANYISKYQQKGNNADVAFKSKYLNGVYFAKDTGVIYVNGKRYGYCNSLDVEAFTDVLYTFPTKDTNPKLTFKNSEGEIIKDLEMFRMYSGTPSSLIVELDENNNYKISLDLKNALKTSKVEDANNLITTDENGQMGVYLGIEHDTENKILKFVSYDAQGEQQVFGEIAEGDYLKNTYLKSVEKASKIVDSDEIDVLRFTWNEDLTNQGLSPTVIDIPITDLVGEYVSEYRNYTINGKKISTNPILNGDDIKVGAYTADEWKPDEEGVYHYEYDVNDTISLALMKIDERLKKAALGANVEKLTSDVESLKTDVSNLKLVSNIDIQGDSAGDFVANVGNNDETNVITVTKGTIAQANLKGYETEDGVLNESYTINSAIQNLDESLTWRKIVEGGQDDIQE